MQEGIGVRELASNIIAKFDDFEPEGPEFSDPFQKNWDEVKDMRGLDTNFKRRTTRVVKGYMEDSKGSPTGHGDSTIKSINHKYNKYTKGYSILDVVQPPYDLTELANFYDKNFAYHAAIDAKV